MKSDIIEIEGIGPVLLEKSRKAKRFVLSVKSDKSIRVAVPYFASFKKANNFANQKKDWILKQLAKIKDAEKKQKTLPKRNQTINSETARQILVDRLNELAEKYGFRFDKVTIRNQKTRWGSCSSKNNISLNVKLAFLPDELRDYVLIHELVHTKIKNHGSKFKIELEKYIKDPKNMKVKLREFQITSF